MKTLPRIASLIICLCSITPLLHAQVPQIINYQGRVLSGSTNFDGSGSFKFALVNAAGTTTYWSNNGLERERLGALCRRLTHGDEGTLLRPARRHFDREHDLRHTFFGFHEL